MIDSSYVKAHYRKANALAELGCWAESRAACTVAIAANNGAAGAAGAQLEALRARCDAALQEAAVVALPEAADATGGVGSTGDDVAASAAAIAPVLAPADPTEARAVAAAAAAALAEEVSKRRELAEKQSMERAAQKVHHAYIYIHHAPCSVIARARAHHASAPCPVQGPVVASFDMTGTRDGGARRASRGSDRDAPSRAGAEARTAGSRGSPRD